MGSTPTPQPVPTPEPSTVVDTPKGCKIEDVLPLSVIELLKTAPHNDTVRAVILAHLKQPIPVDKLTYESIREWIEATIPAPVRHRWNPVPAAPGQPETPGNMILRFDIKGDDEERGRASYTVVRRGRGYRDLNTVDFMRMVSDSDNITELMNQLDEWISDDWESYVEFTDYGEYQYDDHEGNDWVDAEWDYAITDVREFVKSQVLRLSPEEYRRLMDNE